VQREPQPHRLAGTGGVAGGQRAGQALDQPRDDHRLVQADRQHGELPVALRLRRHVRLGDPGGVPGRGQHRHQVVLQAFGGRVAVPAVALDVGRHAQPDGGRPAARVHRQLRGERHPLGQRGPAARGPGHVDVHRQRAVQRRDAGRRLQQRVHAVGAGQDRRRPAVHIGPAEAVAQGAGGAGAGPVGAYPEAAQQPAGRVPGARRERGRHVLAGQPELAAVAVHPGGHHPVVGHLDGEAGGGVPQAGRRLVEVEGEQRAGVRVAGRGGPQPQRRGQRAGRHRIEQRPAAGEAEAQRSGAANVRRHQVAPGQHIVRSQEFVHHLATSAECPVSAMQCGTGPGARTRMKKWSGSGIPQNCGISSGPLTRHT
jgi:hypothetical protein